MLNAAAAAAAPGTEDVLEGKDGGVEDESLDSTGAAANTKNGGDKKLVMEGEEDLLV